jgi:hypothetical protein
MTLFGVTIDTTRHYSEKELAELQAELDKRFDAWAWDFIRATIVLCVGMVICVYVYQKLSS